MLAPKPSKKVPLGKPLRLTDKQLDALAVPSAADKAKVAALWKETVPPEFRNLLDAKEVTGKNG